MLGIGPKICALGGLLLLLLQLSCSTPEAPKATNFHQCMDCHEGIEPMGRGHAFECKTCHLEKAYQTTPVLKNHDPVIRNPSDPAYVSLFCGGCHKKEITHMHTSLHATMAGVINQTRYLWGAQDDAFTPLYSANHALRLLPKSPPHPDGPAQLVDDFLRRKCLRCHLQTRGARAKGLYRASGCAACHVLYNNEGRYEGTDKAISKDRAGYPAVHRFTKHIPNTQCLHCHNHNHVGADYEGLFEHDYSRIYRSRTAAGDPLPRLYGMDHHHLARDIHAEKGMWCIDCHRQKEIMGDGKTYAYSHAVPMITCQDCHAGFFNLEPNRELKSIKKQSDTFTFHSRHTGKTCPLPLFSRQSLNHKITGHQRVRCSACHAQWSFQDYGLSVMREDHAGYDKWRPLTVQGDPYVKDFLERQLGRPRADPPVSPDWIDGMLKKGLWYSGWRFRRWEWMPLGLDQDQRYAVMRPKYQYLVSYIDA
ncbi:MAG: hypothetical protein GY849_01595, partial [Deltaproteobacteria bacterium]|nr:hypothetical protein [Deltaproteobacteria bacterium]